MTQPKDRRKTEFGDFQTPSDLAIQVCDRLSKMGIAPHTVVEPTCGVGAFAVAAVQRFPSLRHLVAIDINPLYVTEANLAVKSLLSQFQIESAQIKAADFFAVEWDTLLSDLPDPILFLGNPPWVTNSELGTLNSGNLPEKRNFQQSHGIQAITGESNFDISEWMLMKMIDMTRRRNGSIAMLCKTSTARRVLLHVWKTHQLQGQCDLFKIDAVHWFGASVDAGLFVLQPGNEANPAICNEYRSLDSTTPQRQIGFQDHQLVSDVGIYRKWRHLTIQGPHSRYQWRSGIKHDASSVMELTVTDKGYQDKTGRVWDLEAEYLYPMLKSSDIAGQLRTTPRFVMLVPQKQINEETASIQLRAPKTWAYLLQHAQLLDKRKSRIYQGRPRFSVFGVGDYSFAPWKVAISGMYKELTFQIVGSYEDKPIVLDDTCYFLACQTEDEAQLLANLLNSTIAQEFLSSLIFWEDKRPINVRLLKLLDLSTLSQELGVDDALNRFHVPVTDENQFAQLRLFEPRSSYNNE